MNDIFRYYLTCFPTFLFLIVSMLMFGTIRMWRVDPESNVMYPFCGFRCGFEAVTPLGMAGNVNVGSHAVLAKWKIACHTIAGGRARRLVERYQKALRRIQCTAGSFYTFENSIVLVSINNCIQLTTNLLVTFEKDQ